ncbi:MAG TPA: prolipoprotein diacylglyceryl transferase [Aliidongia sp.]|nr:prolipoprotein diacylglyceryl transferase [Aliidongia sp.]
MILTIPYPHLDPIALSIGPLAIRWYALAYIAGLVLGWRYCLALAKRPPVMMKPIDIDDFLVWATIGVVLGGRAGYVLFYRPGYYVENPSEILQLWHGGMSFHGGCAGVAVAMWLFARRRNIPIFGLSDIVACAAPIGLFFGRIANFVNGELFGRASDVPWAMVFPNGGPEPRHPSQLYQAGMEGILLFLLLLILARRGVRMRPGIATGAFLIGYSVARSVGELFREPDQQLGFLGDFLRTDAVPSFLHPLAPLVQGVTMGQLLSLPMLIGGIWLIMRAKPIPSSAEA